MVVVLWLCDVVVVGWHGSGGGGHVVSCRCGSGYVMVVVAYLGCCCRSCGHGRDEVGGVGG
jgi:hypothetical protein